MAGGRGPVATTQLRLGSATGSSGELWAASEASAERAAAAAFASETSSGEVSLNRRRATWKGVPRRVSVSSQS